MGYLELSPKWADVLCGQLGPRHCIKNAGVGVIPFSTCTSSACTMTARNLTVSSSCRWPILWAVFCYSHHVHRNFNFDFNLFTQLQCMCMLQYTSSSLPSRMYPSQHPDRPAPELRLSQCHLSHSGDSLKAPNELRCNSKVERDHTMTTS